MKSIAELQQGITDMEASIKADPSTEEFLGEPLKKARRQLAEAQKDDAPKPKTTAKKASAKKTTTRKKTATTPIDYDWRKTYDTSEATPFHFGDDFTYKKLTKDSKVRFYPCRQSNMVKAGHYLVLNPKGEPFTVLSKEAFDKWVKPGLIADKYVTKATHEATKAKLEKAESKPKARSSSKKKSTANTSNKQKTAAASSDEEGKSGAGSCKVTAFDGELPQALLRYLVEQATLYNAAYKEIGGKADEAVFKILNVYQKKGEAGTLVAKVRKDYPWMGRHITESRTYYVNLCINRGIETGKRVKKFRPRLAHWVKVADEAKMSNIYSPGKGKTVSICQALVKKAFGSDGGVEDKAAWDKHRKSCTSEGAAKLGEAYVQWLHAQTKANRKKNENYYKAMERVIATVRKKRS